MVDIVCKHEGCIPYINQDSGCIEGHPNPTRCPHFVKGKESEVADKQEEEHFAVGWYGSAFGMRDLELVTSRSHSHIVGIVGPQNAGKTSFLAVLYLMLNHGHQLNTLSFAGSYTFNGWEKIARNLRLNPGQLQPHFPPHTPRNSDGDSRTPGLLHLAFRDTSEQFRDYLLTDPPGEWFNIWANDKNDPSVKGARWIAHHATSFAFFVDCERLAGNQRGIESGKIERLAQRLSSEVGKCPVAVVWAKSDIEIKNEIRQRLQDTFAQLFPLMREFEVAAIPSSTKQYERGHGVIDTITWLIEERNPNEKIELPMPDSNDPFIAYRGV